MMNEKLLVLVMWMRKERSHFLGSRESRLFSLRTDGANPSKVSTTFFPLVSKEEKVESSHKLLDMPFSTLNKA